VQRTPESVAPQSRLGVALRAQGISRSFRRGAALFSEGDVADRVFLIEHGWVTLRTATPAGGDVILGLRGPGDVVGELSVLDGEPRTATALAIDDVDAVVVPARLMTAMLGREPELAGELLRLLAGRLRESDRQRREFAMLDSLGRVARRLLELAERFGEPTGDGGVRVDLPLSQEQLASWCGCSREATVKALRTLRQVANVTTGRRTITLRDPELLRRHARLG
jgi:CRP/FNR family transcriptional regulator, cyclic AMP receptor protein